MKTPIKAIRAYCVECSGGSTKEVKFCPIKNCPLYPYRMGKRPTLDTYIEDDGLYEKSGSQLPLFLLTGTKTKQKKGIDMVMNWSLAKRMNWIREKAGDKYETGLSSG